MTLVRLKSITCFVLPLMLAFASGDAAVASPAQSGQRVYVDGLDMPVELPVVFPPVKKIPPPTPKPQPTEQELRTHAETGDVAAMEAYADSLSTPSDFPWYLKAAEGGSPRAMMIVTIRARDGETGHGIDLALCNEWLNKALQVGTQAIGRKDVGVLYSIIDGDVYGGDNIFSDIGALDASTKAQYALTIGRAGGFEIYKTADDLNLVYAVLQWFPQTSEKLDLLKKCSDHGHIWCTGFLADDYLYGKDGLVIDHALAIKLLTKQAQAGYGFGLLSPKSSVTPAEWVQLQKTAIEHGGISNALFLAEEYRDGNGVPKSAPIAAALLQTLIQRADTDVDLPELGNWNLKGDAIWDLACMYMDGKSFPVSEQLFLRTLNSVSTLAAQTFHPGQWQVLSGLLSNLYGSLPSTNRDSVNISVSTRLTLLKSAVEKSPPFDSDAVVANDQYHSALALGDLYSSGQEIKQSYADAMTWYQKAYQIVTGSTESITQYYYAAVKIGILYEKGLGVPKDSSIARSWYQKAMNGIISHSSNDPDTSQDLMTLLNSVQLPEESIDQVISLIRSSAQADNQAAQYTLGEMYYAGKYLPQSYSEAAGWFEKCGNHNNRSCLETLGKMYQQGQGVTPDPAKVVYYYQRLVDLGSGNYANPHAEEVLLPMYCGGDGIPMDRPKAVALFKQSLNLSDDLGIGVMYQMGWGVQQDLAEAFNWYQRVAAVKTYSSSQAKADLTRIFRDCKGTPDNFNAAVSLYEKASGGQH